MGEDQELGRDQEVGGDQEIRGYKLTNYYLKRKDW